jgi:hypothetical protein
MLERRLIAATRNIWRSLVGHIRTVQAWRERRQAVIEARKVRGIALLREWLTPEQKAQFEASGYFDVIGCDTGRRYRVHHARGTNVHEMDDTGRPLMGWCFVPLGELVVGDVMLAQKIALETNERAALAIANRFTIPSA